MSSRSRILNQRGGKWLLVHKLWRDLSVRSRAEIQNGPNFLGPFDDGHTANRPRNSPRTGKFARIGDLPPHLCTMSHVTPDLNMGEFTPTNNPSRILSLHTGYPAMKFVSSVGLILRGLNPFMRVFVLSAVSMTINLGYINMCRSIKYVFHLLSGGIEEAFIYVLTEDIEVFRAAILQPFVAMPFPSGAQGVHARCHLLAPQILVSFSCPKLREHHILPP